MKAFTMPTFDVVEHIIGEDGSPARHLVACCGCPNGWVKAKRSAESSNACRTRIDIKYAVEVHDVDCHGRAFMYEDRRDFKPEPCTCGGSESKHDERSGS